MLKTVLIKARTLGVALASLLISAQALALAPEDVSILFPLPDAKPSELLLGAGTQGAHGTVFPRAVYDRVPRLTFMIESEDAIYSALKVVGARLDPCFTHLAPADSRGCQAQVRLVLQPFRAKHPSEDPRDAGLWVTEDAAIHLFYRLTSQELSSLAARIDGLRAKHSLPPAPQKTLGVHEGLRSRGLESPYATDLKRELLAAIGERRLVRATFMTVGGRNTMWKFGGFDVLEGGALREIDVANVPKQQREPGDKGAITQTVLRSFRIDATVRPKAARGDHANYFFDGAPNADWVSLDEPLKKLARIENPIANGPHSVDCASCHAAESARLWAQEEMGASSMPAIDGEYRPWLEVSDGIRESKIARLTANFRAFGYLFRKPSVSQRVVNETERVLETLRWEQLRQETLD